MPDFPRHYLAALHDAATRLLDSRKTGTPSDSFARELLIRFDDVCRWQGLDGVLAQLPADFTDDPATLSALAARLDEADLDGGGPRNARPGKVIDQVLGALGLTLADEPDRTLTVDEAVHAEALAAVTSVVEPELAPHKLREAIVAHARERCDAHHQPVFDKIVAQLDDRGLRMTKQPKVPLDASQAIQRLLTEAREAVLGRVASAAIDRARDVIARADAAAAARIDQPVTQQLTPRQVVIARLCDDRSSKVPATVAAALVDGISELSRLAWRKAEVPARPYAASQTFAVGELIDHPKFGRGTVAAVLGQRIDVEFADGKHTLVHKRS